MIRKSCRLFGQRSCARAKEAHDPEKLQTFRTRMRRVTAHSVVERSPRRMRKREPAEAIHAERIRLSPRQCKPSQSGGEPARLRLQQVSARAARPGRTEGTAGDGVDERPPDERHARHSSRRRHRRRSDGQRYRPCVRARGLRGGAERCLGGARQGRASPPSTAIWRARWASRRSAKVTARRRSRVSVPPPISTRSPTATSSSRRRSRRKT